MELKHHQTTINKYQYTECLLCRQKKSNTTFNSCNHQFCHNCIVKWLKKHKVCPICKQIPQIMTYNDRNYTIKKRRIMTWRPQLSAPQISVIFKGMHQQLFQGDTDVLLPPLETFIQNVVQLSMVMWKKQGQEAVDRE